MTDRPMSNRQHVIQESFDASKACKLISAMTHGEPAVIERKMYYPYFRFDGKCSVPGLFGRRATQLNCLVDAVNGLGATTDHFIVDHRQLNDGEVIATNISHENAMRVAQRTVTHRMTRRLRMIAAFGLALESQGIIYKGFWIVGSASATVMVDSVTGGLHPLNIRAA